MTNSYINLLDPAVRRNPYPYYAALQRDHPVCRVDPAGMWAISRHEDVSFLLKNHEIFSSTGFRKAWEPSWVEYNPLARSMVTMDPPGHTRLRALIQRGFGTKAVLRLEEKVSELARNLARGLDGEVDAGNAFSMQVPAFAVGELLALDERLHSEFKRWTDDLMSITPAPPSEERQAQVRASITEFTGYLGELIEDRRRRPRNDTVTELVQAEADGQALTKRELIEFMAILLVGGLETTAHLVSNTLLLWSERPDLFDTVRADPSCLPDFMDEMMRYDGATHLVPRLTVQDVKLHGVTIPAGELVMALMAAANRDERVFKDPHQFDMKRGSRGGLAFGLGHHFCIGAALARMTTRVMLSAIIEHMQRIEPVGVDIEYNRTFTSRGPVRLPLRFIPA